MTYKILPSLLSADPMKLGQDIDAVLKAGADMLHLDIMDNHYVPNLTFGPELCHSIHQYTPTTPIDVHLMVNPVDTLIERFATAGASRISIHPDATIHLDRSLQLIHAIPLDSSKIVPPNARSLTPTMLVFGMIHEVLFLPIWLGYILVNTH